MKGGIEREKERGRDRRGEDKGYKEKWNFFFCVFFGDLRMFFVD